MKRVLLLSLFALFVGTRVSAADFVTLPHFSNTDKGLFGKPIGKGRIYCDLTLPPLTGDLLIDVGMAMSQMPGVIGQAPKWFAMFSPTACSQEVLFTAPKCQSAIMFTIRIYF